MAQPVSVQFNDKNNRREKRDGQFPIECYIKVVGRSGKHLNKRHAFYGGLEVAQRDLTTVPLGEGRFICLKDQNLSNLDLSGADLRNADLSGAICHNTNFSGAQMDGANIENADLTGAAMTSVQLRAATGKPYAYPYGRGVTATKMAALRKTARNPAP